jgi:hypothetical protein
MRGGCRAAHAGGMNGRNSRRAPRLRKALAVSGIACAVLVGVWGLAMVSFFVIAIVVMSHYGSNK